MQNRKRETLEIEYEGKSASDAACRQNNGYAYLSDGYWNRAACWRADLGTLRADGTGLQYAGCGCRRYGSLRRTARFDCEGVGNGYDKQQARGKNGRQHGPRGRHCFGGADRNDWRLRDEQRR